MFYSFKIYFLASEESKRAVGWPQLNDKRRLSGETHDVVALARNLTRSPPLVSVLLPVCLRTTDMATEEVESIFVWTV